MAKKKSGVVKKPGLLVLLGIVFIIGSVWLNSNDKDVANDVLSDTAQIAQGQLVYEQNCLACHGAEGEGHGEVAEAPALNGSEHSWHHADGLLYEIISDGIITMPSFENELSHDDRVAVIRYFQSWWSADILSGQQGASQQYPMP